MYKSFSNTFTSETEGAKKFFFTVNKQHVGQEAIYEGKINDDKSVKKFQMRRDAAGAWKIQSQQLPEWVLSMEQNFSTRIEASIGAK